MDKKFGKGIVALAAVLAVVFFLSGSGSAQTQSDMVYGKIADSNFKEVAGADVVVSCDATSSSVSTKSSDGTMVSTWDGSIMDKGVYETPNGAFLCPIGSGVTVKASKNGKSGVNAGIISDSGIANVGVSIVDVVFAPEIVALLGAAMILAPGLAYAVTRKRK